MMRRSELILSQFQYKIPESRVAQLPLRKRDQARLMIIDRKTKKITHDVFSHIDKYLPKDACLVLNDSEVIPARLLGRKQRTDGKVELFLLKKLSDGYSYETLIRPLKKIKDGDRIIFNNNGVYAQVVDRDQRIVRFNKKELTGFLKVQGHMPLPPYIKRKDRALDYKYYQTVYAKKKGSVAAPTAGLHFTKGLLKKLQKQGRTITFVTLHVNYATFKPVEEKDVTKHKMHEESFSVRKEAFREINQAHAHRRPIIAVGTTSCRVLETLAHKKHRTGQTDLFIYPGYRFSSVDMLITNFHLPSSTLLMLVCAFGETSLVKKAYKEAIKQKYRFYSYGDAMLIK